MSDVYYVQCARCEQEALELADSPACLSKVTKGRSAMKHRSLLIVESEIEYGNGKKKGGGSDKKSPKKDKKVQSPRKKSGNNNKSEKGVQEEEYEIADDAVSLNGDLGDDVAKMGMMNELDANQMIRVNGREEFPVEETKTKAITQQQKTKVVELPKVHGEGIKEHREKKSSKTQSTASSTTSSNSRFSLIYRKTSNKLSLKSKYPPVDSSTENANDKPNRRNSTSNSSSCNKQEDVNGNNSGTKSDPEQEPESSPEQDRRDSANISEALRTLRAKKACSTLPKVKKPTYNSFYLRPHSMSGRPVDHVPKKRTPDGTDIYYWCDYHPKKKG